MRRIILGFLVLSAALAGGCTGSGTAYYGGGGTLTATTVASDLVYVSPGFQVVADYDDPVFYADNFYWRYDNGIWYRSSWYTGGWVYATPPHAVLRIERPYAYRRYRPAGYVARGTYVRDHRDYFITATFGFFLRKLRFVVTPKRMGVADATRQSLWPQYLVLGLNAMAIPVGLALFWKGGGLPTGALVANVLWASVTLGVAASALRFALRTSGSRRREYRFPLPIPLRVRAGRNVAIGLATDISPLGCRVVGAPVSSARGGDELTGELLLPNGPLPVRMIVRTVLAGGDNKVVPVALAGVRRVRHRRVGVIGAPAPGTRNTPLHNRGESPLCARFE